MRFFLLLILSFAAQNLYSQDPRFTLADQSQVYNNPAFAGTADNFRQTFQYRNQWPQLSGNYMTYTSSTDMFLNEKNAIGLSLTSDVAGQGTLTTNSAILSYVRALSLGEFSEIRIGLSAGLINKRLDWSQLTFNDMIDPRSGFVYSTAEIPNDGNASKGLINMGLLFNHESFFIGYGVHYLNQPNMSLIGGETRLTSRHDFQLGYNEKVGEKGMFTFTNQTIVQSSNSISAFMAQFIYGKFLIGSGFLLNNLDYIPVRVGVNFKSFRLMYSYESIIKADGLDGLTNVSSHELNLQIFLNLTEQRNALSIKY